MLDVYCNDSVQTRKLFKSRIMHQAECELQILSEDLELSMTILELIQKWMIILLILY